MYFLLVLILNINIIHYNFKLAIYLLKRRNKVTKNTVNISAEQLNAFIERVERLEDEMANIRNDIKEIYAEARSVGYDPKIMKVVLRLKKLDEADRSELDELTETYRAALNV